RPALQAGVVRHAARSGGGAAREAPAAAASPAGAVVVNLKPKDGFATLIAAVVFVVVMVICVRLHVHAYVGTLTFLAVGGAYVLARRIARGSPELARDEWTLHAADLGNGQVAD